MHLQQELAVLWSEVRRMEDDFTIEIRASLDRSRRRSDREGCTALTQDRTPSEVCRVVERILERHNTTDA